MVFLLQAVLASGLWDASGRVEAPRSTRILSSSVYHAAAAFTIAAVAYMAVRAGRTVRFRRVELRCAAKFSRWNCVP